jgi:hypothetical protein
MVFRILLLCSQANPTATFPVRLLYWQFRLPPLSPFHAGSRRRPRPWFSLSCRELVKSSLPQVYRHADLGCKRGSRNCIPRRTRRCDGAECAWCSSTARRPRLSHCVLRPPGVHTDGDDRARRMRVCTFTQYLYLSSVLPGTHSAACNMRRSRISCRS